MMRYLSIAVMLSLFWLLLSGLVIPLLLVLGGVSVAIVVYLVARMDRIDGAPTRLRPGVKLLGYLSWLLWQVVLSNVALARRVWHPDLPIEPAWEKLPTRVVSPLEKTLYANSITLTPGTLTTDVGNDHFMIHCLSTEGIDDLRRGDMERRIMDIGF